MTLGEFYDKHKVKRRLKGERRILIVCPEQGYDVSHFVSAFMIDKSQYEVTWFKGDEKTGYEILMGEVQYGNYRLVVQVDCMWSKKLPQWGSKGESKNIAEKVLEARGQTFVNLHHHDEFSIRDGLGKVGDLVKLLKAQNGLFCAVTNHGGIGGWIKQYNACRKARIKPLFGIEAYVNDYRGEDPDERKQHRSNFHLVLLAKTEEGFYNIIRIHNDAQLNGFYYLPRANYATLKEFGSGIVALSACYSGEIATALANEDEEAALVAYERYKEAFDEFYIELTMIEWPEQIEMNRKLIRFAQKVGAPMVVTLDSHYLYPEHSETHDILMLIRYGRTSLEKNDSVDEGWQFKTKNLCYRSEEGIRELWEEGFDFYLEDGTSQHYEYQNEVFTKEILEEAILNTRRIAVGCDDIELDSTLKLPRLYDDAAVELERRAWEGLRKRGLKGIKKYDERLSFELEVITRLGYEDYFLVVEKIVNDARKQYGEFAVGWGRGSAGGSLVSYSLGITDLDPIRYGLLFERFLDYGRTTDCPDIDLDFRKSKRDWVKEHIVKEFGEEHTCSIGTYQTYKTASVIIDVARALGHDVWDAMKVTKKLDGQTRHELGDEEMAVDQMPFEDLFEFYPELKEYLEKFPAIYQHAKVLRNQVKNMGKHAGGVIISDLVLSDRVPVYRDKSGQIVSTWTEGMATHELSTVGLVKFDILGLTNLDIIQDTLDNVAKNRGIQLTKADVDIDHRDSIRLSSRQDLVGIFQFENPATKPVADAVRMESIFDIGAVTSLIRPGPRDMGMDKQYAERKRGNVEYEVPSCLREVLQETYGIIAYQEQAMLMAQQLAGFSAVESNQLRKVLIKEKDERILEAMQKRFMEGAKDRIARGEITEDEVRLWWDLALSFTRYGFCKSHAFEYAAVSGAEFFLKHHYPTEYLCAVINNAKTAGVKGATPPHVIYINYARRRGISVARPCINRSKAQFVIDDGKIRFSFTHIKHLGKSATLVESCQPYADLDDFFKRINRRKANKRVVASLIASGAFDEFGTRNEVLQRYYELRKEKEPPVLMSEEEWQRAEADAIGVCLSRMPIRFEYAETIRENRWCTIDKLSTRGRTYVFGRVDEARQTLSKAKNPMMIVTLSDDVDSVDFYVWQSAFRKFQMQVKKGYIIAVPLKKFDEGEGRFFDSAKDVTVVKR